MSQAQHLLPNIRTELPGPRSKEQASLLRGVECSGISAAAAGRSPVFWKQGLGCMLHDVDGNIFLDMTSSFGVAGLGYSHPSIVGAITDQAKALVHTMNGIFPTEAYVSTLLAIKARVGRTPRSEVLLTNSGSEAIEAALKIAARATGRAGVLAFYGSYHGQSIGALGITSHNFLRDPFVSLLGASATFVPYPDPIRPWCGGSGSALLDATLSLVRQTINGGASGAAPIGAIVVEPMQNPRGYVVPPPGFLKGLREICSETGTLLIVDEIFTGFGRCGSWLLADTENVVADVACVGKIMSGGTPIAACVADRSLCSSLVSNHLVPLQGGTFFGNPLTCAAAVAAIGVLHTDHLVERANTRGHALLEEASVRAAPHRFVKCVRGKGFALALDLIDPLTGRPDPPRAMRLCTELFRRGVVTLITGLPECNAVALCPPLTISDEQLTFVLGQLEATLASMET